MRVGRIVRLAKEATGAVWYDVRANRLGQRWPLKPMTLNLLANDICNSRCQMCRIWTRKRDKEITPDELANILRDPLFDRLRYVGVSGGEPTLREDLPQIFRAIVKTRPQLGSVGIITNAIQADAVIDRVLASAHICREAGVRLNIMVSLDGVGEVHDRIRGREGNFESAVKVIRFFRNRADIPVRFGCTISKDNVWHVDELLDFARQEGLHGHFRVAEFIQRLYNEEQTTVIRNFVPVEAYHLGLFFTKLERTFERNPKCRRTYRNIRSMLMQGAKRTIRCPYQTQAVVLDCRGQLLYCSPKSPVLGSALEVSAERIYRDSINKRRHILTHDCQDCIHDYHAQATTKELVQRANAYLWRRRLVVRTRSVQRRIRSQNSPVQEYESPVLHALIIGWYGTETAGDKAILGEIVHRLKEQGARRITLASLNPFLSEWTIKELGHPEIVVIPTYSADLLRVASVADETIMGGGPLMDLAALGPMLSAFVQAKKSGRRVRIAGCGIGPLQQTRYIQTVKRMIELADVVELRDSNSVHWAVQNTGRTDIVASGDPAEGFARRWQAAQTQSFVHQKTLNCYFREWSAEYKGELSMEEFSELKMRFEEQLGLGVASLCERLSLRPRLLAMHHFVVGGDDRDFNRRWANRYLAHLDPIVEMRPFSVFEILESMEESMMCLTMRFHSTLFAHVLGVPYAAVDYTRGGKVRSFLADQHALNRLVTFEQVVDGLWQDSVGGLVAHEHFAN